MGRAVRKWQHGLCRQLHMRLSPWQCGSIVAIDLQGRGQCQVEGGGRALAPQRHAELAMGARQNPMARNQEVAETLPTRPLPIECPGGERRRNRGNDKKDECVEHNTVKARAGGESAR